MIQSWHSRANHTFTQYIFGVDLSSYISRICHNHINQIWFHVMSMKLLYQSILKSNFCLISVMVVLQTTIQVGTTAWWNHGFQVNYSEQSRDANWLRGNNKLVKMQQTCSTEYFLDRTFKRKRLNDNKTLHFLITADDSVSWRYVRIYRTFLQKILIRDYTKSSKNI